MAGDLDEPVVHTEDERLFFRPDPRPEDAFIPLRPPPKLRGGRYRKRARWKPDWAAYVRAFRQAVEREAALGTPFLFIPVALLVGAVVYFSLPTEPAPHNLPVAALAFTIAAFVLRARLAGRVLLVAALLTGGMLLAQWHTRLAGTQMLGSAVTTRLTGRVVSIEERANGRTRFTIDVLATERPHLRYAPERVRATAPGDAGEFRIGDGIHGVLRLLPASGPARPGGYDFAFHNFHDGIGANGFFYGRPDRVDVAQAAGWRARFDTSVERLRRAISHEVRGVAPGRSGAVSAALITGDKAPIPEAVNEALRVSGLAHILSISGLHMALVAATVMFTLRFLFALAPVWSSAHPVRKYAAAAALVATGFYLFLAGAGVATQRSFVMLAVMLAALTFDRSAVTMRNLALAALVVICVAPDEIVGPGFQMSFAATAALIAVYGGWQEWRSRAERRTFVEKPGGLPALLRTLAGYALGLAATSLIAGLATGIFAAYHFGRVAPYGLIANLLAMPLVTLAIMPMAVLGVILMPVGLHAIPLKVMAWGVERVISIAEAVAGLSPAVATGYMPGIALLAFSGALVLGCLLSTRLRVGALPLLALGIVAWSGRSMPVAVISEDGRQFAVMDGEGGIHVNRPRPSAFILEQWSAAYGTPDIVKPAASALMQCADDVCTAEISTNPSLTIGYYAVSPTGADPPLPGLEAICRTSDLVIFAAAPSPQQCRDGTPVISAQMLALNGSVEIFLDSPGTGPPRLTVRHALPGPTRPWLDHRRYSRAARNLAEWRPDDQ